MRSQETTHRKSKRTARRTGTTDPALTRPDPLTFEGRKRSRRRKTAASIGVIAIVLLSGLTAAPASAVRENAAREAAEPVTMGAPLVRADMGPAQWQIDGVGSPASYMPSSRPAGYGITVAVIADGVDDLHPDLIGATLPGWDATARKPTRPGSLHTYGSAGGNGTFQATVIAGNDDGAGVRGIAPAAKIVPVVVEGNGALKDDDVAAAVEWAVRAGAKVLTLSLGISEGSTADEATETCRVVTAARSSGVLTFVPVVNDELMTDSSFRPYDCTDAVGVTAVGENLTNHLNHRIAGRPTLSAPGYGIVGGRAGGSNLPYTVSSSTSWAPAAAAGAAAAIWSARPALSSEQLLELITSSATELGDPSVYGAGLVDVTAALSTATSGVTRRSAEQRRSEIAASSVPVVVDANRDGNGRTALSWLPPFGTDVERYQVVVSRWSERKKQWVESTTSHGRGTVRAVIAGELHDNAYATVIAVTATGQRRSVPVNYTRYNPVSPRYELDETEAAVVSGSARWVNEGIEVSVEVNDRSRPWALLVIDPEIAEPVKELKVRPGRVRHLITIGKNDDLRNRRLLIAAGMGRNGVDLALLPQYGLKVSVVPAGKDRAGVTGTVTCAAGGIFDCGTRDLVEGTEVKVVDWKSKNVIATAVVRSDRSFSAVWAQKDSSYDVVVQAGRERSMRYTSSFFIR
jgi:hypothetical protein